MLFVSNLSISVTQLTTWDYQRTSFFLFDTEKCLQIIQQPDILSVTSI
jgi:hypothetical protein